MSAPYHNIEERVEDAVAAYLAGALTSPTSALTIKKAFDFGETEPPCIVVAVPKVEEYPPDTGGYAVDLAVAVLTSKSSSRATHSGHVAKVCDLLFEADILTYLNTHGTTYGVVFMQRTIDARERRVEGSTRITEQKMTFLARVT